LVPHPRVLQVATAPSTCDKRHIAVAAAAAEVGYEVFKGLLRKKKAAALARSGFFFVWLCRVLQQWHH
jgi:hypothetical protein